MTLDQRLGIAGGILEQLVEAVFFMSIFDALANAQELLAGTARGAQCKLDHRMHDRALGSLGDVKERVVRNESARILAETRRSRHAARSPKPEARSPKPEATC
nr:hypothetical protein [Halomonas elongata]